MTPNGRVSNIYGQQKLPIVILLAAIILSWDCVSKLAGFLNVHEWYGWCGCTVDDLRRQPPFPFKPHVSRCSFINKSK